MASSSSPVASSSSTAAASASSSYSPPYPSAARLSDSQCFPQYSASLKCLEEHNSDKSKCQQQFDDYKECKKREGDVEGMVESLINDKNLETG